MIKPLSVSFTPKKKSGFLNIAKKKSFFGSSHFLFVLTLDLQKKLSHYVKVYFIEQTLYRLWLAV